MPSLAAVEALRPILPLALVVFHPVACVITGWPLVCQRSNGDKRVDPALHGLGPYLHLAVFVLGLMRAAVRAALLAGVRGDLGQVLDAPRGLGVLPPVRDLVQEFLVESVVVGVVLRVVVRFAHIFDVVLRDDR